MKKNRDITIVILIYLTTSLRFFYRCYYLNRGIDNNNRNILLGIRC